MLPERHLQECHFTDTGAPEPQVRTDKAYKLVKGLEEAELLQPQPDNTPLNDAQRNRINKLMVAIQQLKFGAK